MAQSQKTIFAEHRQVLAVEIKKLILEGNHIDHVVRLGKFQHFDMGSLSLADWLIIYTPEKKGGIVKA